MLYGFWAWFTCHEVGQFVLYLYGTRLRTADKIHPLFLTNDHGKVPSSECVCKV